MQQAPDVYADGLTVGVGPFGYTLIFLRSMPRIPEAPGASAVTNEIVSVVRMSRELAETLATNITNALQATPPAPGEGQSEQPRQLEQG
jgi:hypothetical protein